MTRKQILKHLKEAHGLPLKYYQIDYAVNASLIPAVKLDENGNREYDDRHVAALVRLHETKTPQ